MRVLVLVASTDRRGAEIEGLRLAGELAVLGIQTETAALAPGAGEVQLDISTLGSSPRSLSTLMTLRRRARHADVVIAYGSTTLPACAIALLGARTPFVYRSIGDPTAWVRGRLHRRRTSLLLHRAAAVVTLWPGSERTMRELYDIPAERLISIPNARSSEDFHPPSHGDRVAARRRYGVADGQFVVAVVGSLAPEKRIDLALSAIALVPDAHLLIAGEGTERGRLEDVVMGAPDLAGRVQILGAVANVPGVLHASDLLLLTSSTEGMPGVLIEAGLCGLPAVSTQVGAIDWLFARAVVAGETIPSDSTARDVAAAIERVRRGEWNATARPSPCEWVSVAEQWKFQLTEVVRRHAAPLEPTP